MADWPASPLPAALALSPFSPESMGGFLSFAGSSLGSAASAAWPTANRALYFPIRIQKSVLYRVAFIQHGATLSGNWDMGIFQWNGKKVWSLGSTAQSGGVANTVQVLSINAGAGVRLEPGLYYLALAMNGTTGTVFRTAPSGQPVGLAGAATQTSAFALPDPITPAASAQGFVPVFALGRNATL